MSDAAKAWAASARTVCPCAGSKDVLKGLAQWAGELDFSWVSIGRLAGECQRSDRQIKRLLMKLVEARLVVRYDVFDRLTGRQRTTAYFIPYARSRPDATAIRALEEFLAARVTLVTPSPLDGEGDAHDTPRGDADVTGEGVTHVTRGVTPMSPLVKETLEDSSEAYASSPGVSGRANDVREIVEAIWRIWPEFGRKWSSRKLLTEAIMPILAEGVTGKRLISAAVAYVADKASWGTSGKPKNCADFYAEGRWENFGDAAEIARLGEEPADLFGFEGPMSVWNAVVSAEGEDFAKSYLRKSIWRDSDATILAASTIAAARLSKIFDKLERAGVREVIWKGAA